MPTHKPMKKDAVLEKAIAGYNKDPSVIDIFSAQDKVYSTQVNEGLHHNWHASTVKKNLPCEEMLNVRMVEDNDFVSRTFGPKSRMEHKHKPAKPIKHDEVLEKALNGFEKDTSKIDVFSASDKEYSKQVNYGISHHTTFAKLKAGLPEQAPSSAKEHSDNLLNVSSPEDNDFISRTFGAKSRS